MTNELENTERTPLKVNHRAFEIESEMSENSSAPPKPEMDDTKRIALKFFIDFATILLSKYSICVTLKLNGGLSAEEC